MKGPGKACKRASRPAYGTAGDSAGQGHPPGMSLAERRGGNRSVIPDTTRREAADAGIDADALAEHLQRHRAGAFTADWAALLTAIKEKAAKPRNTPEAK